MDRRSGEVRHFDQYDVDIDVYSEDRIGVVASTDPGERWRSGRHTSSDEYPHGFLPDGCSEVDSIYPRNRSICIPGRVVDRSARWSGSRSWRGARYPTRAEVK